MTAEEYVVSKVQQQEEDIRLMQGHIDSLRLTVRENIDYLNFLLDLIKEDCSYDGHPVYELHVSSKYDPDEFAKLKEIKERNVF